jgi:hypothetical protein
MMISGDPIPKVLDKVNYVPRGLKAPKAVALIERLVMGGDERRSWIRALGDDDPQVRIKATRELFDEGRSIIPHLREAYTRARDPEVRSRLRQLMKEYEGCWPEIGQAHLRLVSIDILIALGTDDAKAVLRRIANEGRRYLERRRAAGK